MRTAIYARLSLVTESDATGIDRQLADCRQLAESRHATDVVEYIDSGISAYDRRAIRPEFERLLGDVKAGRFDLVIAYRADRLARQHWDGARLLRAIEDAPTPPTVLTSSDRIDTSTNPGQTMFVLSVLQGNAESAAISARTRSSHKQRAESGRFSGGPRAFGHNANRSETVPDEAQAIEDAARRILDGESVYSILRDWKARGIKTPRANDFQHNALVKLLQQPRLVGLRILNGVEGSGSIPAILDRDTWDRLCRKLADPSRRPPLPGGQVRHLLSGLMTCAECGVTMGAKGNSGKKNGPNYWTYGCIGTRPGSCGRVWIKGEPTDEYIADLVQKALRSPGLAQRLAGDPADIGQDAEARREHVAAVELAVAIETEWNMRTRSVDDPVRDAAYRQSSALAARRVEETKRRLGHVERATDLAAVLNDPTKAWDSGSLEDRRNLVRLICPSISVEAASRRRWSQDRISVVLAD
jgi:DNA invertase Pin-like site-specific DNA recombinase